MTNKKIISKTKKEKILKKAAQLFLESGYRNTTTKELAKAIGIQGPGFYHYFNSKEDVLLEILEMGARKFQEYVIDYLSDASDPEEKIKRLIRNLIRVIAKFGEIPLLFDKSLLKNITKKAKGEKGVREKHAYYFMREILQRFAETRGNRETIDLNVATFSLIGMSVWTQKWYNPKGKLTIEELADQMIHLFLHGFLSNQTLVSQIRSPEEVI